MWKSLLVAIMALIAMIACEESVTKSNSWGQRDTVIVITRDTILKSFRDTLFLIRKDTLFVFQKDTIVQVIDTLYLGSRDTVYISHTGSQIYGFKGKISELVWIPVKRSMAYCWLFDGDPILKPETRCSFDDLSWWSNHTAIDSFFVENGYFSLQWNQPLTDSTWIKTVTTDWVNFGVEFLQSSVRFHGKIGWNPDIRQPNIPLTYESAKVKISENLNYQIQLISPVLK